MKNIEEIKEQISNWEAKPPEDKRLRKKAEKRVAFLRKVAMYLETKPNEDFIQNSIGELKTRLITISENYPIWKSNGNGAGKSNPYSAYKTEMGVKKIKDQLATLNFLIK